MAEFLFDMEMANGAIPIYSLAYYPKGVFWILAIFSAIYLFFKREDLRYKFVLPVVVIFLVATNSILYVFIYSRIIYWRLFWMVPTGLLVGAAVVTLLQNMKKTWAKWLVFMGVAICIMSCGQNTFGYGVQWERQNWEKVSAETKEVCDIILAIDERPRIVAPESIFCEVRQYAPEIEMLYGRNAHYFIGTVNWDSRFAWEILNQKIVQYENLMELVNKYSANFIVWNVELDVKILEQYQYYEVDRTQNCIIYYKETAY